MDWGFEPTTCGSEDLKCNNKEINHHSSQDRSLPNNNNPQIVGPKPLVLFRDWLQSQGKQRQNHQRNCQPWNFWW
jgi:hypothetical protein